MSTPTDTVEPGDIARRSISETLRRLAIVQGFIRAHRHQLPPAFDVTDHSGYVYLTWWGGQADADRLARSFGLPETQPGIWTWRVRRHDLTLNLIAYAGSDR